MARAHGVCTATMLGTCPPWAPAEDRRPPDASHSSREGSHLVSFLPFLLGSAGPPGSCTHSQQDNRSRRCVLSCRPFPSSLRASWVLRGAKGHLLGPGVAWNSAEGPGFPQPRWGLGGLAGPPSPQALGWTVSSRGCRQHVLLYWASKALNTERAGEGLGVGAPTSENGYVSEKSQNQR